MNGRIMAGGVLVCVIFACWVVWQDGMASVAARNAECGLAFRAAHTPAESVAVIDKRGACAYALARLQQVKR